MPAWAESDSRLEVTSDGETYTPVPLLREPYHGIDWTCALIDLAEAIAERRPHRMGAEHAAHVLDVLEAAHASADRGVAMDVRSDFPRPEPLDWAR
jgi:hypothetical protein